jgi:hypothetical protein
MAKAPRRYVITRTQVRTGDTTQSPPLPLQEAIEYYSYTLDTGSSWQHEKGNKKINRKPRTIKSLISNLNNAVNNAAANGYAGVVYSAEEFVGKAVEPEAAA